MNLCMQNTNMHKAFSSKVFPLFYEKKSLLLLSRDITLSGADGVPYTTPPKLATLTVISLKSLDFLTT